MFNKKNKIGKKKGSKLYISQKAYNNPYFKDVNKTSRSSFVSSMSWKAKISVILIVIFIFSIVWLIFYSKYFLIYDIEINIEKINDIGRIGEDDIEKMAREELRSKFVFLPGNNIFLFDENKLYNKLSTDFAFEEIRVEKKLPNKLHIYLREVSYALIWKEQEEYFYITPKGDVINSVSPEEIKEIFPLVENKGRDLIVNGSVQDKNEHLRFSIELYKTFKDTNIFNIDPKR
jgi:cell division septal protein FtsQ